MSEQTSVRGATASRPRLPVWLLVAVFGFFGLFYAFALWTGVAFLLQQASGVEGLSTYGWFVLSLPVAFPALVFIAAFALTWRRRFGAIVWSLLAGLALVAGFWLDILVYAIGEPSLFAR